MALHQRSRRRPQAPEGVGIGILCLVVAVALSWFGAYTKHLNAPPEIDFGVVSNTRTLPPTMEEEFHRVLKNMQLDFHYTEVDTPTYHNNEQPAVAPRRDGPNRFGSTQDEWNMAAMPKIAMAAPDFRLSEGRGAFNVVLPELTPREMQVVEGLNAYQAMTARPRIPRPEPHVAWTMIFALTYLAAMYYFCRVYPAWRKIY